MSQGLNIQDIASMVNVIDMVSSRGAIRGEEMLNVGALRSKLVEFVEGQQKEQAAIIASGEDDVKTDGSEDVPTPAPEVKEDPKKTPTK